MFGLRKRLAAAETENLNLALRFDAWERTYADHRELILRDLCGHGSDLSELAAKVASQKEQILGLDAALAAVRIELATLRASVVPVGLFNHFVTSQNKIETSIWRFINDIRPSAFKKTGSVLKAAAQPQKPKSRAKARVA